MIDRCLIIDTETTDISPDTGTLIEVGAILYSVRHKGIIAIQSTLKEAAANPAERVNGISPALLTEAAQLPPSMPAVFMEMYKLADVVVAHNADFDRQWFKSSFHTKEWVCTCYDFAWPMGDVGMSLTSLALAHGIGVNMAHRAVNDCLLIAELFTRCGAGNNLQAMFAHAMRPKATFISLAPFEQKDLVKSWGFKWCPERKQWERRMAIADAVELPFRTIEKKDASTPDAAL